jgi:hypothetical protein
LVKPVRFDIRNVEKLDCSDVKVVKIAGSCFSLVHTVLFNVPHDRVATYQPKFCIKAAERSYFGWPDNASKAENCAATVSIRKPTALPQKWLCSMRIISKAVTIPKLSEPLFRASQRSGKNP